jgi:MFS family permease
MTAAAPDGTAVERSLSGAAVAALMLAAMQTPLGSTMISVALPAIASDLGRDISTVTGLLVPTSFFISVVCQGPGGKLVDISGRWRVFHIGLALFGAGALLGAVSPGLALLVVSRCLMALGGAVLTPATLALLRTLVSGEARGRVFGFYSATVGLAAALGPVLGGAVMDFGGWRAIFAVSVPFALVIACFTRRRDPRPAGIAAPSPGAARRRSIDWQGLLLLALALGALFGAGGMAAIFRGPALGLGGVLLAVFLIWEARARDPIVDPRLFRNRHFAAGCAIIFFQSLAMYGLLFGLPLFFAGARGATPGATGRMLFVMMLGMFAASAASGYAAARIGPRLTAVCGVASMALGALWLTRLQLFAGPPDATGAVLMVGLGVGFCWGPAQAVAMAAVPTGRAGMAAGVSSTLRYLGGGIGTLCLSAAMAASGGADMDALVRAVWVFAGAVLVSACGCLALPRK